MDYLCADAGVVVFIWPLWPLKLISMSSMRLDESTLDCSSSLSGT